MTLFVVRVSRATELFEKNFIVKPPFGFGRGESGSVGLAEGRSVAQEPRFGESVAQKSVKSTPNFLRFYPRGVCRRFEPITGGT
jgi:hypothetical protein